MLNTAFPPWPAFTEEDSQAVSNVLRSNRVNYWTGEECRQFEAEFAAWCGAHYAVALMNGTVALDLALKAIGIRPGDEVIVTPRSFIASVSSVVNAGAVPRFSDVDLESGNISVPYVESLINKKTKAILCVHLAGWPCDMDAIIDLANQHQLMVIEDCAQAHGAGYKSTSVGSLGHVSAWSFCQDKIMTTGGEGGMITTNDVAIWSAVWSLKDHGKSYEAVYKKQHPPGFRWVHDRFGGNGRMTEIQAVLGRLQLKRMQDWHSQRIANATRVWQSASALSGLRVPVVPKDREHAAYKAYVYVEPKVLKRHWTRDRILNELNQRGIPCYSGICPEIYKEKAFENTEFRPSKPLPNAVTMGETSLMFLVHPTLTSEHINKTCEALTEVMKLAV